MYVDRECKQASGERVKGLKRKGAEDAQGARTGVGLYGQRRSRRAKERSARDALHVCPKTIILSSTLVPRFAIETKQQQNMFIHQNLSSIFKSDESLLITVRLLIKF
jgi:hypothetical protein